jgi:Holliday junction DNA helicase RuvB
LAEQESRMVTSMMLQEDREAELTLRPKTLDEYIGQEMIKEQLSIFIHAALKRKEPWIMFCCTALRGWEKQPLLP